MSHFKKEAILNIVILSLPLLVIVISGSISYGRLREKINLELMKMENVREALENFKKDIGRYPSSEEGPEALIENPKLEGWQKPWIEKEQLVDSWGQQYKYGNYLIDDKHIVFIGSSGRNKKWETSKLDIENRMPGGNDIIIWLQ